MRPVGLRTFPYRLRTLRDSNARYHAHDRGNFQSRSTIMSATSSSTVDSGIRPFRVEVPEERLADLRRRITAARLPHRELVNDRTQGVQLATD
jgi:hypothetical protein